MPGKALCLDEREEIRAAIERGDSARPIASALRRDATTISREVKRNSGRRYYRAANAQRRCDRKRRRPKPFKLMTNRKLGTEVERGLNLGFSPGAMDGKPGDNFVYNGGRYNFVYANKPPTGKATSSWEPASVDTAVITLVERTSRRVVLVPLSGGYNAGAVADGLITAFSDVPVTSAAASPGTKAQKCRCGAT